MSGKRVLLLLAALALLWVAFFRRKAPVVANQGIDPSTGRVIGTQENIKATANQAVANTVGAAGNQLATSVNEWGGVIIGGVAKSLSGYFSGNGDNSTTVTGGGGFETDTSQFADANVNDGDAYSDSGAIDSTL